MLGLGFDHPFSIDVGSSPTMLCSNNDAIVQRLGHLFDSEEISVRVTVALLLARWCSGSIGVFEAPDKGSIPLRA